MYTILDNYLPPNLMDKDEQDARALLKSNWDLLSAESEKRQDDLSTKQADYKRTSSRP